MDGSSELGFNTTNEKVGVTDAHLGVHGIISGLLIEQIIHSNSNNVTKISCAYNYCEGKYINRLKMK